MIYIEQNKVNLVILQLTSNSFLNNPNYLFEYKNDMSPNNITYFIGTDLSSFKCRYNRFNITLTGASYVDYSAATLNLRTGSYTYTVYEASSPTLHISGTTGRILDTGKVYVDGDDSDLADVYK
jgi:hypothetical protein